MVDEKPSPPNKITAAEDVVGLINDVLLSQPSGSGDALEEQIVSISQEIAATLDFSQSTDEGRTGDIGAEDHARPTERTDPERDTERRSMATDVPIAAQRAAIVLDGAVSVGGQRELDQLLAEALDEDDEDFFPVPLRARKATGEKRKR